LNQKEVLETLENIVFANKVILGMFLKSPFSFSSKQELLQKKVVMFSSW